MHFKIGEANIGKETQKLTLLEPEDKRSQLSQTKEEFYILKEDYHKTPTLAKNGATLKLGSVPQH